MTKTEKVGEFEKLGRLEFITTNSLSVDDSVDKSLKILKGKNPQLDFHGYRVSPDKTDITYRVNEPGTWLEPLAEVVSCDGGRVCYKVFSNFALDIFNSSFK